jgi:hypothetical protein
MCSGSSLKDNHARQLTCIQVVLSETAQNGCDLFCLKKGALCLSRIGAVPRF